MILNVEINENGILNIPLPQSLWGKKIIVSISEESDFETSNWDKISAALEKVDALDLPHKTSDEIIAELRFFRETE